MERVEGERLARDGGGLEQAEPADLAAELPHPGTVAPGFANAPALDGEGDPRQVAGARGVADQLVRGHGRKECSTPPMMPRA